jgi:hypothetical protein
MSDTTLIDSVHSLRGMAIKMDEAVLEKPWEWSSYDEGVRFVFFRALEEFRSLAVRLAQARVAVGQAPSQAQRILAQYHAAYRDFEGAVTGLDEAAFTQPPAQGEWPVQRAMAHIVGADMGFYVVVRYALEYHRSGDGRPERFDDAVYDAYLGMNEARYEELMNRPADGLLAYYEILHQRILTEFSLIGDDEIDLPANYWEKETHPLRFRLGRFESHLRQHTIQIDKTLAALGRLPGEPLRLVRMVYAALAEAEGARLGAPDIGTGLVTETAGEISGWVGEISA